MTSIFIARQTSDPTAASPTVAHEPRTGRTPNAWAAGRGDEFQSQTFRALAWSQEDDSLAEPLPYTGDAYSVPEVDSRPTVRIADAAEPSPGNRYRRSTLLYGIAAGFAAAAIGGLLLTMVNTDDGPTTISTKVSQPATNVVNPQPNIETVPIRSSSPAPVKTGGAPAHVVSSAVAPSHALSAPAPAAQTPAAPEAAAPAVAEPEAAAPAVAEPEAAAPAAAAPAAAPVTEAPAAATPEFTPPQAKPPVWVPPVIPQKVPYPLGPLQVPTIPDPVRVPPASNPSTPLLSLRPGLTVPPMIPPMSGGSGQ